MASTYAVVTRLVISHLVRAASHNVKLTTTP